MESLTSCEMAPPRAKWGVCHWTSAWGFCVRLGSAFLTPLASPVPLEKGVSTSCFLSNSWHLSYCFYFFGRAVLCAINIWFVPLWKCTRHCRLLLAGIPCLHPHSWDLPGGWNKVGILSALQTLRKLAVLLMPPSSTGVGAADNAFSLLWHLCSVPPITLTTWTSR